MSNQEVTRRAICSCGELSLSCHGEPVRVSICHCLACQQRTGSAFGIQARFTREQVTSIEGSEREFVRVGDSGGRITFHFCPQCGSTVYYVVEVEPELIAVPVGAFADPKFPAPNYSVYGSRRHPWAEMPALDIEEMG